VRRPGFEPWKSRAVTESERARLPPVQIPPRRLLWSLSVANTVLWNSSEGG